MGISVACEVAGFGFADLPPPGEVIAALGGVSCRVREWSRSSWVTMSRISLTSRCKEASISRLGWEAWKIPSAKYRSLPATVAALLACLLGAGVTEADGTEPPIWLMWSFPSSEQ